MGEEKRELSAVKILAMIGILYWFYDAIAYFVSFAPGNELFILYGIIELVFALYLFMALKYWDLIPLNLPYFWWLLLVFGAVTLIFGYLGLAISYFAGTLIIMAGLIEFLGDKKGWKASNMMAILGAAFGIYDCIIIFYGFSVLPMFPEHLVGAIFGLIFVIILIILIFDFVDIKIPYEWWVLLIIGFMFFTWFSGYAAIYALIAGVPIAGWAGIILLIAFVLLAFGF